MTQPVVPPTEPGSDLRLDGMINLALMPQSKLPEYAWEMSAIWLLDWLVSVRSGANERSTAILRDMISDEEGQGVASVVGGLPAPARGAALVNAASGHAQDVDDTHLAHASHASTAIYAAALAVGEMLDCQVEDLRAAFLVGAEVALRIGNELGETHHSRGFDIAATSGAFGGTVAAARLLGLSRSQFHSALGLCSTRAAGLREQFGTMGKAYSLGAAAATGIECALLAQRGYASVHDGLFGPSGFLAAHSRTSASELTVGEEFLFENIRPKLHGSSYGTHATIEALLAAPPVTPAQISRIRLHLAPRWITPRSTSAPVSGLDIAFNHSWLAAMVINGRSTHSLKSLTNALVDNPELMATAAKITVTGNPQLAELQVAGEIETIDGRHLQFSHDLNDPLPLRELRTRMNAKVRSSIPDPKRILEAIEQLDDLTAHEIGALLGPRQTGVGLLSPTRMPRSKGGLIQR